MSNEQQDNNELIVEVDLNEQETKEETVSSQEERVLTPFEQEQVKKGWNPNGVKSAEEWERTTQLYDKIESITKVNKHLKKTVASLAETLKKQEKMAYDKAMADFATQKDEAIKKGDANAVKQIEANQQEFQKQDVPAAVIDFKEKYSDIFNSTDYEEMQIVDFLQQRDVELAKKKLDPDRHMELLEEHMLKRFPDYFNKATPVSQSVESATSSSTVKTTNKKQVSFSDLPPEYKQVAIDLEKYGAMKREDYIKELVKLGIVK